MKRIEHLEAEVQTANQLALHGAALHRRLVFALKPLLGKKMVALTPHTRLNKKAKEIVDAEISLYFKQYDQKPILSAYVSMPRFWCNENDLFLELRDTYRVSESSCSYVERTFLLCAVSVDGTLTKIEPGIPDDSPTIAQYDAASILSSIKQIDELRKQISDLKKSFYPFQDFLSPYRE